MAADFNRDNRLDCLIINSTAAHLLTNNGGTNFSALIGHGLPRLEFPEITPADLDQDGDVDLVLNGTLNSSALFRFWYNSNEPLVSSAEVTDAGARAFPRRSRSIVRLPAQPLSKSLRGTSAGRVRPVRHCP